MQQYFAIYKPYQVLSRFTSEAGKQCLADYYQLPKNVYPVGRLDYDSEGLLILTNDTTLNHRLLHPNFRHERTYWVQVDGAINEQALQQLSKGVSINVDGKNYTTLPAQAHMLGDLATIPARNPPIRYRQQIPAPWIQLTLHEGKNRQVRKMTAAVGFPTLRLIRYSIGNLQLGSLQPGQIIEISRNTLFKKLFHA